MFNLFENVVLRRIFGPVREDDTGAWEMLCKGKTR